MPSVNRNGKGDKQRPKLISNEEYNKNYNQIYQNHKSEKGNAIITNGKVYWWTVENAVMVISTRTTWVKVFIENLNKEWPNTTRKNQVKNFVRKYL